MREIDGRIVWAPRVPREKIHRLYESEAAGLLDEDLLHDVAWAIWERCQDIRTATRAHTGEATCPRCAALVTHAGEKHALVRCSCGWSATWESYHRSYQGKQLVGGGSMPWVEEFAEALPKVSGVREEMLLVDRLINRWHWDLRHPEPREKVLAPIRPAAQNVIGGNRAQILELLGRLAGIDPPDDPERRANRESFEANRRASDAWFAEQRARLAAAKR